MNFEDYAEQDAVGLARLIRTKAVSAKEVTEAAIEAAERLNPQLNALVMTNFDNAREQVKKACLIPLFRARLSILKMSISSLQICRLRFPAGSLRGRLPERIVNWCRDGVMPGW